MLSFQTILVPVDLSETAKRAFHLGCELAAGKNGRLVLLHVYPPPLSQAVIDEKAAGHYADSLRRELESIKPADCNLAVTYRVEEGFAVDEIARVAAEEKVDLIVMGTHGRSGLMRMLMGSVAEGVLRIAPCPVLTVSIPSLRT